MNIRFQADADLNQIILSGTIRREPLIDFRSAHQAVFSGLDDFEVLAIAARSGRVLVSHDQKTMPSHFARFIMANTSPGVILIPQHIPVSSAIEDLILIWSATSAAEWVNRIYYLPL